MWSQSPSVAAGGEATALSLYSCPGCPSPAYLPAQEIPHHDTARHSEATFKCLACRVSSVSDCNEMSGS